MDRQGYKEQKQKINSKVRKKEAEHVFEKDMKSLEKAYEKTQPRFGGPRLKRSER